MNSYFYLAVLCTFVSSLYALQVGDFVTITGLVNKSEYNGSIGLVQKLSETVDRHHILKADSECILSGMNFEECMKSISIKEDNLLPVQWKVPEKLSITEILNNYSETGRVSNNTEHEISDEEFNVINQLIHVIGITEDYRKRGLFQMPDFLERLLRNFKPYVDRTIPIEEREFLDSISLRIREICHDNPNHLRRLKNIEKLRLIGAWINQNHDFHAMVYVSEVFAPLKEEIECLWDSIGVWTKEKFVTVHI